ncbi:polycystin family receptor for egg jelly-like isoform X12 [Mytilus californianus]|uniref:polycystin family receptor for egg jelly-like isoform X12 n=1 Tax=Mytilus californianus TaxID=6549 RepID=UPI0022466CE0|nr:polycystin family receptor for egg jelly-like isoform X12 [Mytilus californianus]
MSSGDFKSVTNGHNTTWVIVRVHIEQGWVYEAQGSVFYETSSHPFGGVVFAFSDSQIRLWVPKRGAGSSNANGVPFNAMHGWGEFGDFGYSKTVRVRAFVWDFKSFDHNPIVLEQTSYITNDNFISVPPAYSFHDNNLLLFSIKAESGNNQGYQFYPAGSSMTDGTTDSNNTKFGSFVYGFTDDKLYYWTPNVNASGCVLLLDGLWGSQNQQHCLSESSNDVALMITFNVLTLGEPACGVFPCSGTSDRGQECNCTGSEKGEQFCDNEATNFTTVERLSSSTSSQSDEATNFTTVERLSSSTSSQSDEATHFTTVERLSSSTSSQSDEATNFTTVERWSTSTSPQSDEATNFTTVERWSTSTSTQSDDATNFTTVERLSSSTSSQSDEATNFTTVERWSTSTSPQSDDTTNFTTVERLSSSTSSQSDDADLGYTTTSFYMEPDCFDIKTLFGTSYKDENSPLPMLITNDNTITSKVVVTKTCQNSQRNYYWELRQQLQKATNNQSINQKGTYFKNQYHTNPVNQPKSAAIFFGKESIAEGKYLIRMVVNLTDSDEWLEDEMYVEFRLPPIVTSIQGGSVRYINKNNDLVIDAGPVTYDKVQKYKSVPFTYEWLCRKGLNQSQVDTVLGKFGLPGAPDIITIGTSCNEPSSGAKWTIPSENLSVDTWYLLQVKTKKITNIMDEKLLGIADTIRSATALQAVKVHIGDTPTINILCRKNCLPKLSLNSLLILNADCPECSLSDINYEWSILVYNSTTEVFDSLNSVPRINQSRLIVTSLTANEIGIRPDALREMDRIRFHLLLRTPGRSHSQAEYIVSVNAPPYGGSCSITPSTGITVKTKFTIACKNWFDEGERYVQNRADDGNELLTYSIYHVRNTTTGILESLLSTTGDSSIVTTLAVGDPGNNFHSIIRVNIIDFYNGYTEVDLQVTINNVISTDRTTQSDTELIKTITELVNDGMDEARISNDPKQVIHQASTIVASITLTPIQPETFNTTDNPLEWVSGLLEATKNGTKPYNDILNDLIKYYQDPVKVVIVQAVENLTKEMEVKLMSDDLTFYMTEMATSAFATALSNNKLVNNFAGTSGSNALTNLATSFKNASETALLTNGLFDSSDPHLDSTSAAIMTLLSAIVGVTLTSTFSEKSLPLISATTADARKQVDFFANMYGDDAYKTMEDGELTPEERTGLYLLRARISHAEFEGKQILASLTDTSIDATLQVINDQGLNMICKGCKTTFKTKHVNLYIFKATLQERGGRYKWDIQAFNEVPNGILQISTIPMRLGDMNDITSLGIANFPQNVYIAGRTDTALVTSNVHKLFLKDKNKENFIPTKVAINQTTQALQFSQNLPVYTEGDASYLFYHSFFYRDNGDYVCVSVHPVQDVPNCVTSYDVYVKFDSQPTHLNYDAKGRTSPDNDRMICFPPQLFSSTGEMHVALHANSKVVFGSLGYVWKPITGRYANGSYNISAPALMPYNLHIVTSNCKEWDPKRKSWDSINCEMDWFPRQHIIECTCRPAFGLTFGNTFYVAPNRIDFSTVFLRFDITNQGPVIGTLITILVIYVLLLIWARHQDKRDIARWGVTPLIDNFVDDTYYYLVTVYTGMRRGAGTRSRIGLIVHGKDGGTGIRELSDGVRSEIPAASVVHFLMSTTYPLGDLSYVYIWHDSSGEGESSSWYLNRVDVEDIQKRERFIFLCGKWLCLDTVDSSVDAVLPVCGKENVTTFSNMFYLNIKENLADNHMWISIFFRPTSSHYTRCQRLTCFLLFIVLTMVGNAIYFRDEDEYSNGGSDIRVGPFSFSLKGIYIAFISALISTPTTVLVILMFNKSKHRKNTTKDYSRRYRIPVLDCWFDRLMTDSHKLEKALVSKGLFKTESTNFPYWFQYIAWLLALAGIGACSVFLTLYSVEWGEKKSEKWLVQFFLSFCSSICLLDPLKVIFMSAIFAMLVKQTDKFRPTGLERSLILKNYKHTFGYEKNIRLPASPLNHSSMEKARNERQKEIKMMESIKQVLITCFCLWIIYSISYSYKDDRSYNFHQNIATKLLTPQNKTLQQFGKITHVKDYMKWLQYTAFPELYPETDYTGERLHWRLRQNFHDLTSFRVGPPRLRQLRVTESSEVLPFFGKIRTRPKYYLPMEEDRDFCFGWASGICDKEREARSFSYAGWKFTSAVDIWGIPIPGHYSTYGGGGYITELAVNFDFSNRTLNELTDYLWIDRNTRAVYLEFNLYAPDLNLFANSMFLAEFPETGGIVTSYSIYPFRIYFHLGTNGIYTLICEIIFLSIVIALTGKVVSGVMKKRKTFFKSVWNILDFSCISLSFVCISMYAGRHILASQTMEKFKEDPKQFINFQHIAIWDLLFNLLHATLLSFSTLRLVGILGYDKRVGKIFLVFNNCAKDLFWSGIFILYVFLCYAALGYLLFGKYIESYCDIFESMGTLFISMMGKSKFTELNAKDPIIAQFYFFTFILVTVFTLLTMFMAILGESISAVHTITKRRMEEELIESLWNKFKNLFVRKSEPTKNSKKQPFQNTSIGLLYDIRKAFNDDDDDKKFPRVTTKFEKRAKRIFDNNK